MSSLERRFPVILEPGEDGYVVAHCPDLPGCHSQGHTYEEALRNIREAITGWLEVNEGRQVEVKIGDVRALAMVH